MQLPCSYWNKRLKILRGGDDDDDDDDDDIKEND